MYRCTRGNSAVGRGWGLAYDDVESGRDESAKAGPTSVIVIRRSGQHSKKVEKRPGGNRLRPEEGNCAKEKAR